MFNLREFVLNTIKGMVGNLPDFKVREYALSWHTRGTLTEADLEEIDGLILANMPVEEAFDEENAVVEGQEAE